MVLKRRLAALFLPCWLIGFSVMADIDPAEYELKRSIRTDKERQRMKAVLEEEKKVEAEQHRQEDAEEAGRIAESRARLEARPYPVRLTEARCVTRCHGAENYEAQSHTWLGWWVTVIRMEYLNGASLNAGEKPVVVDYLSKVRPATGVDALQEYTWVFLILTLPPGMGWVWFRYRRGLKVVKEIVK